MFLVLPHAQEFSGEKQKTKKTTHWTISFIFPLPSAEPWPLRNSEVPGSDVRPWKGWGGERVPFSAQVCVCNFLPMRKHSAQISPGSSFLALASQEELAVSRGPRWSQPDFLAKRARRDALDRPALCSR